MKKFLSMTLALSLSMLTACGGGTTAPSTSTSTDSGTTGDTTQSAPAVEINEAYADIKVGVVQLAEHPALDDATQGFLETLLAAGVPEGNIEIQNAQGEQANCATIAMKFVNDDVDLILAVATPAAQAVASATTEIPILATAVTDFPVAGLTADNISGVSDMGPVARQVELVLEVAPDAETIGVLHCSSEDNSIMQAEIALEVLDGLGVASQVFTVADSNEVQSVVSSMVGKVDAVYIPTDNLLAQTMATVALVANPAKLPVIVGESGMVDGGGLATIGVNYHGLGIATAEMALEIFDGADISTMEVGFSDEASWEPAVNEDTLAALEIELPESLLG